MLVILLHSSDVTETHFTAPSPRFLKIIQDCCQHLLSSTENYFNTIRRLSASYQSITRVSDVGDIIFKFGAKNLIKGLTNDPKLPFSTPYSQNTLPRILFCQSDDGSLNTDCSDFKMTLSNIGLAHGFNTKRPEDYLRHTGTNEQFAMATGMLSDMYVT